ncbi:MAG: UDP-N-acetylmuramate dehydrogenase [Thiolinea sp.]
MKIYENYPLKNLHTLGVDVRARYFCRLSKLGGLKSVMQWQREHADLPVLLLGGGSNMLFLDDYPGLVVQVCIAERKVLGEDGEYVYIRAGAGENWHDFVRWTIAQGYAGLENLSLIPGTVGAAPMQNIGAYGVELKDCFYSLQALDWRTAELREFDREACQFSYRDSFFKSVEPGRWLIASVTFRLPLTPEWKMDYAGVWEALAGQEPSAERVSDAVINIRRSKLPDPAVLGNAGSFFKNPVLSAEQWQQLREKFTDLPGWPQDDGMVKTSAGWLIDQCGWKGQRDGDAGTYDKHALILVNHGSASGAELWAFAQRIIESVEKQFGVTLEPEPRLI